MEFYDLTSKILFATESLRYYGNYWRNVNNSDLIIEDVQFA